MSIDRGILDVETLGLRVVSVFPRVLLLLLILLLLLCCVQIICPPLCVYLSSVFFALFNIPLHIRVPFQHQSENCENKT